jgi:hypothetical protein
VFEGDEVFRSVLGPDATFIVAKGHVHDPMEAVFDTPYSMPLII